MDNKGQNFIHMYTVCELLKQNKLIYNVKFDRGNEETGNDDISDLLRLQR